MTNNKIIKDTAEYNYKLGYEKAKKDMEQELKDAQEHYFKLEQDYLKLNKQLEELKRINDMGVIVKCGDSC